MLSMASGSVATLASKGYQRAVGECLVVRQGDRLLLMRAQEPENIQSEWDIANARAPDYAGTIAAIATGALRRRAPEGRLLMLGLGGGTIAASVLRDVQNASVVAVEHDRDVIEAAQRFFYPFMLSPRLEERLHVLQACALRFVHGEAEAHVAEHRGAFDVLVEDFGYDEFGLLREPFWRALRGLAAPGATLIVNTLYRSRAEIEMLSRHLAAAGWHGERRILDGGGGMEEWDPSINVIFTAELRADSDGRLPCTTDETRTSTAVPLRNLAK